MRNKRNTKGFTLLDMLICISALLIVAGLIVSTGKQVKYHAHTTICMNNLRQITVAMATYFNDHGDYPRGLPYNTLANQLNSYISNERVFVCPEDRIEQQDSYSQFYVYRGEDTISGKYVIGCPRHHNDDIMTAVFSLQSAQKGKVADIKVDDTVIKPGILTKGTLELEDGSTISSDDTQIFVVQSMKLDNGTLYTLLRVIDGESGTVSVNATHGTKLEIVTPSVIAGVRGTVFSIQLSSDENRPVSLVSVTDGKVCVTPLDGMRMENGALVGAGRQNILLTAGNSVEIYTEPPPGNTHDIEVRLNILHKKIVKGVHQGMKMRREKSLFKWLLKFSNKTYGALPGEQDGQNETTYAAMTDANGFTTKLTTSISNGQATIMLAMSSSPATPKDLSHMVIELPADLWEIALQSATSSGGFPVTVGFDPTTGVSGIKFDDTELKGSQHDNCTVQFSIPASRLHSMSKLKVTTKAGNNIASSDINLDK